MKQIPENSKKVNKLLLEQMELLSKKSKTVAENSDVSATTELCNLTSALCEAIRTYDTSC